MWWTSSVAWAAACAALLQAADARILYGSTPVQFTPDFVKPEGVYGAGILRGACALLPPWFVHVHADVRIPIHLAHTVVPAHPSAPTCAQRSEVASEMHRLA